MKYVANTVYYHNCPIHDGGSSGTPFFFNELPELLVFIQANLNERHVEEIYECETGKECEDFGVSYESARHSYSGCIVSTSSAFHHLQDNGHGELTWTENEI